MQRRQFGVVLLLCALMSATGTVLAMNTPIWEPRSIYQIMTDRFSTSNSTTAPCGDLGNYCGGTWRGILSHLDYIQGMGFDAIWISPVIMNTPGGYHGYWAQDFGKLNPSFGTEDDLKALVSAVHARNMLIMVGVVANHVGPVGNDYSTIVPFNRPDEYHNCDPCPANCQIQDFMNQPQVELCRLSGLPDLNQTEPFVRQYLKQWIQKLVVKYDLDGIRIDTVPEVEKGFWSEFQTAADVYSLGEVYDGRVDYVASYQQPKGPLTGLLSYPLFFQLRNCFAYKNSLYNLQNVLSDYNKLVPDVRDLGTFLDNHDQIRFLHVQPDYALYKAALTYVFMASGIPILYYGSEQGFSGGADPLNREPLWTTNFNTSATLYQYVKVLNQYRKQWKLWNYNQVQRYASDNFYAFTVGTAFVALTNVGTNGPQQHITITYHPYRENEKLCNIFWPQVDCVVVLNGKFDVYLNNGESKIYYPVSGH